MSAWGLAGYGKGELTVTAPGGERVETGLRMRMGAVGARGTLVPAAAGGGFELALKTDALWMRVSSDAAEEAPRGSAPMRAGCGSCSMPRGSLRPRAGRR